MRKQSGGEIGSAEMCDAYFGKSSHPPLKMIKDSDTAKSSLPVHNPIKLLTNINPRGIFIYFCTSGCSNRGQRVQLRLEVRRRHVTINPSPWSHLVLFLTPLSLADVWIMNTLTFLHMDILETSLQVMDFLTLNKSQWRFEVWVTRCNSGHRSVLECCPLTFVAMISITNHLKIARNPFFFLEGFFESTSGLHVSTYAVLLYSIKWANWCKINAPRWVKQSNKKFIKRLLLH